MLAGGVGIGVPVPAYARRFGRYTLLMKLASRGAAEVFLARLSTIAGFEKVVVLKILLPELAVDERMVRAFAAEAQLAAPVTHANVCEVQDFGQADGTYYIVLEHLFGVPLSTLSKRMQRWRDGRDIRLVAGLLEQACDGLQAGHDAGVVHHHLHPNNLFITEEGMVKVLDLGVAWEEGATKRTGPGVHARYAYMSPEQVRLEAVDARSNVFSLGTILHELVTGRSLFVRSSDFLTCQAIAEQPIPDVREFRPEVPPELSQALARALDRDPAQRFPHPRALGETVVQATRPMGGRLYPAAIAAELERVCSEDLEERRAPLRRLAEDDDTSFFELQPVTTPMPRVEPLASVETRRLKKTGPRQVPMPVLIGLACGLGLTVGFLIWLLFL